MRNAAGQAPLLNCLSAELELLVKLLAVEVELEGVEAEAVGSRRGSIWLSGVKESIRQTGRLGVQAASENSGGS
jgi:hypothetical protein